MLCYFIRYSSIRPIMNRDLEIMENGMFTKIKNTIFGYNIISPVQKECEMLENKSVYLQRAVFI